MNDFRQVTVCAADCQSPQLAARALDRSMRRCDFAQALLFTDTPVPTQARCVAIERIDSMQAYNRFALGGLGDHITTPFALIVQWDGFVLDEARWDPAFLGYDYIGAPWPPVPGGIDVGNGGFSLRSRRLLDALRDPVLAYDGQEVEDVFICRSRRRLLQERFGIRFAPTEVARRFSHENLPPDPPPFGFHGVFNFWRHLPEDEVLEIAALMVPRARTTPMYLHLVAAYMEHGRLAAARQLFELAFQGLSEASILACMQLYCRDDLQGKAFRLLCRRMLGV